MKPILLALALFLAACGPRWGDRPMPPMPVYTPAAAPSPEEAARNLAIMQHIIESTPYQPPLNCVFIAGTAIC